MNATDQQLILKRNFRLQEGQRPFDPAAWYRDDAFVTQLLNAYTLLIPDGEHFIIRTCKTYLNRVEPDLEEELRGLFYQEGAHAREHQKVLDAMRDQGLRLDRLATLINVLSYRLLEPFSPHVLRLSTAAAIEHHNAAIATFFLRQNLLRGSSNGELRRLFLWHFCEEIEHKEVVFKLLENVSSSWFVRTLGLAFSMATFLFFLGTGALVLGVKTGAALTPGFWRSGFVQCFHREGLLRSLLAASLRYVRPSFRPRIADSRSLLDAALAELGRLGVDGPAPQQQALPSAFRAMIDPFLERAREMEPRHPFFFGKIDTYDGPWVRNEGQRKLNFCTYSYLGLVQHPKIQRAAVAAIHKYGTGTHGVRLLGGNLDIHEKLESTIAQFLGREAAITFSSGFMTNIAVIGTLLRKGDFALSDTLNHASILDGCRASRARLVRFKHNDMRDLEEKLRKLPTEARKLIVVDAVFSMDGDLAPLPTLIALRNRYPNTILMVDEAHSLGVLGDHGRGIEEHFDCHGQVDLLMGTLSKTVPSQGGYIAASSGLIKFLRYNARGFIFSAALSPAATAAAQAGFEIIEAEGTQIRKRLFANIDHFKRGLREAGFDVGNSESAIIPILLGDEAMAFEMARLCNLNGVYAMPVVHPAVARGTERLRMNVTSTHRTSDLDEAIQALVRARSELAAPMRQMQAHC